MGHDHFPILNEQIIACGRNRTVLSFVLYVICLLDGFAWAYHNFEQGKKQIKSELVCFYHNK